MRKLFSILLCIIGLLFLSSCNNPYQYTKDDLDLAWQEGFDAGYDGAATDFDKIYEFAYEEGFSDGSRKSGVNVEEIFREIYYEAEDYASELTGWSVYEAWNNVLIYMDDPSEISKNDFLSSVETLTYFSMYLDEFDYNPRKYE